MGFGGGCEMFLAGIGTIIGLLAAACLARAGVAWPWVTLAFLLLSGAGWLSGALCEAAARADRELLERAR